MNILSYLIKLIKNTPPILNIRIYNHRRIYLRRHKKYIENMKKESIEKIYLTNNKLNIFEKCFIDKSNSFITIINDIQNNIKILLNIQNSYIENDIKDRILIINNCNTILDNLKNDLNNNYKNINNNIINIYDDKLILQRDILFNRLNEFIENIIRENELFKINDNILENTIENLTSIENILYEINQTEINSGIKYDIILKYIKNYKDNINMNNKIAGNCNKIELLKDNINNIYIDNLIVN